LAFLLVTMQNAEDLVSEVHLRCYWDTMSYIVYSAYYASMRVIDWLSCLSVYVCLYEPYAVWLYDGSVVRRPGSLAAWQPAHRWSFID
jgi:hypothetical protein